MRPITFSVGPLASAADNNIAQSQTPLAAGALTLNGTTVTAGVAVLDVARQVLLTFAADETGHSFVVRGTNGTGDTISETVAGTGIGTTHTVLSYKTVTSVTISAAATGAIKVGTNTVADSSWIFFDPWAGPAISLQCTASGTVTYTAMITNDDPNSPTNAVSPASVTWVNAPDTALQSATGTVVSQLTAVPAYVKVQVSGGSGSVTATAIQNSNAPY